MVNKNIKNLVNSVYVKFNKAFPPGLIHNPNGFYH
jgi:hypothetical protein